MEQRSDSVNLLTQMRLTKKEAIRKTLVKEILESKLKLPILLIETLSPVGNFTGGNDLFGTDCESGRAVM